MPNPSDPSEPSMSAADQIIRAVRHANRQSAETTDAPEPSNQSFWLVDIFDKAYIEAWVLALVFATEEEARAGRIGYAILCGVLSAILQIVVSRWSWIKTQAPVSAARLHSISTDPKWWIGTLMFFLAFLALSPFAQEGRWPTLPFYKITGSPATLIVTRGNPEIGKAVAAAQGPTYVKDIILDWTAQKPLMLYVTVTKSAPKLRIVLQTSQYFPSPNDDFSSIYPSIVLGEFDNVIEGQIIRIPIVSLASPPYQGEQLVFGKKPLDTTGSQYFVNTTLYLARVFFLIGDSGEPQNYKFAFFVSSDPTQRIVVLRNDDLNSIEKWRRK